MTTDDSQRPETWLNEDPEDELAQRRQETLRGGGEERIESQHDKGKLTARERLDYFLDQGTFREVGPFVEHQHDEFGLDENRVAGDAVVTGYGEVNGRKVFVYALDFTVLGGSVGEAVADKICKVTEMAIEMSVIIPGARSFSSGTAIWRNGIPP